MYLWYLDLFWLSKTSNWISICHTVTSQNYVTQRQPDFFLFCYLKVLNCSIFENLTKWVFWIIIRGCIAQIKQSDKIHVCHIVTIFQLILHFFQNLITRPNEAGSPSAAHQNLQKDQTKLLMCSPWCLHARGRKHSIVLHVYACGCLLLQVYAKCPT